jgi:hypothetical protein
MSKRAKMTDLAASLATAKVVPAKLEQVESLTLQLLQSRLEAATKDRDMFAMRLAQKYGDGAESVNFGLDGSIVRTSKKAAP